MPKTEGYTKTTIMGGGTEIVCKCGYVGCAEVIRSTFCAGKLERCPKCKGKNYSEVIVMNWIIDEWKGCYPSSWKGVIVPEAMSHPAKFSSKLIRKIYEHMKAEGWLKEGDMVLDPFGGVALGALDAMRLGLRWRGMELEARFAGLGWWNISNWNAKYKGTAHWCPDAQLLNGDSRKLIQTLHGGNGVISPPPMTKTAPKAENGNQYEFPFMEGPGEEIQGSTEVETEGVQPGSISAAISSPPFRHSEGGTPEPKPGGSIDSALYARHAAGNSAAEGYGGTPGQLANMDEGDFSAAVSSPPFNANGANATHGETKGFHSYDENESKNRMKRDYILGNSDGNIGNFKMDQDGFEAAVSSPPYADISQSGGTAGLKKHGTGLTQGDACFSEYGAADGQLGAMKAEGFDAAVSSPPFENQEGANAARKFRDPAAFAKWKAEGYKNGKVKGHGSSEEAILKSMQRDNAQVYGETPGQLGNDSGDDFWMAARTIVEQVYQALAPGAHAAWVVKGFVKNKEYVDFPDQWRRLCEAVGFVTVHEHRALLVHSKGKSHTLEGGVVEHKTESKSFFRRLYEKKGGPRIDWETVWCMVKPEGTSK